MLWISCASDSGKEAWVIEDMAIPELFYFKFIVIASHIHSSGEIRIPSMCQWSRN